MRHRQWSFAAQALGTLGLLVLLFREFDWPGFWSLFGRVPAGFYAFALGTLLLGQLLYAFRWQVVLRAMGVRVAYPRLVQQYLVGIFFSNLLPTVIGGDVAKVYYLGREEGYLQVGASVFMDRFLGFFSLTVLGAGLFWWLGLTSPVFLVVRGLLSGLLLLFVAAFLIALFLPIDRLKARPGGLGTRLERFGVELRRFLLQVRGVARTPWVIAAALAMVFAYSLLAAGIYQGFFVLATGVGVAFWPLVAALMGLAILTNVPITVNGIGLREQLHYLLLATLGLSKETAVGISLLVYSLFVILSLAGYLLWLWLGRGSGRQEAGGDER